MSYQKKILAKSLLKMIGSSCILSSVEVYHLNQNDKLFECFLTRNINIFGNSESIKSITQNDFRGLLVLTKEFMCYSGFELWFLS